MDPITLTVRVTAEDIAAGERCEAGKCAIALALIRASGMRATVTQTLAHIYPDEGAAIMRAEMPAEASEFVRLFDIRGPVQPFEFTATFHQHRLTS